MCKKVSKMFKKSPMQIFDKKMKIWYAAMVSQYLYNFFIMTNLETISSVNKPNWKKTDRELLDNTSPDLWKSKEYVLHDASIALKSLAEQVKTGIWQKWGKKSIEKKESGKNVVKLGMVVSEHGKDAHVTKMLKSTKNVQPVQINDDYWTWLNPKTGKLMEIAKGVYMWKIIERITKWKDIYLRVDTNKWETIMNARTLIEVNEIEKSNIESYNFTQKAEYLDEQADSLKQEAEYLDEQAKKLRLEAEDLYIEYKTLKQKRNIFNIFSDDSSNKLKEVWEKISEMHEKEKEVKKLKKEARQKRVEASDKKLKSFYPLNSIESVK